MNKASILFLVFGSVGFFGGIAVNLFLRRRKFYRRNNAGLEEFSSFRKSLITPFLERLLNLIAILFIVVGIGFLLLCFHAME